DRESVVVTPAGRADAWEVASAVRSWLSTPDPAFRKSTDSHGGRFRCRWDGVEQAGWSRRALHSTDLIMTTPSPKPAPAADAAQSSATATANILVRATDEPLREPRPPASPPSTSSGDRPRPDPPSISVVVPAY